MDRISIKEFVANNKIVSISKAVRISEQNKYPFISFLVGDDKRTCINVFFSKSTAETLIGGEVVDKAFLANYDIMDVQNADGEVRTKLVAKGGNYNDVADLFD